MANKRERDWKQTPDQDTGAFDELFPSEPQSVYPGFLAEHPLIRVRLNE